MIVLTATTMNDADIVELFVKYHLNQGIDRILLMDAGSDDGTLDVLQPFIASKDVVLIDTDAEQNREKTDRRNKMKKYAEDNYGATWVISSDVDEFWLGARGTLKEHLSELTTAVTFGVSCSRHNMIGNARGEKTLNRPFYVGDFQNSVLHPFKNTNEDKASGDLRHPWIYGWVAPKVACRGDGAVAIGKGGHSIIGKNARSTATRDIRILHFPMRSFSQFKDKVNRIRGFVSANSLIGFDAWHWRRWLAMAEHGTLEEEYLQNVLSAKDLQAESIKARLSDESEFCGELMSLGAA